MRDWCLEHGKSRSMRIVLCGYDGEHEELAQHGWRCIPWRRHRGYAQWCLNATRGRANRHRERLWASPTCLRNEPEVRLFEWETTTWSRT